MFFQAFWPYFSKLNLKPLQKVIFATKPQNHKSITKIDMLILSVLRDFVLWCFGGIFNVLTF